MSRGKKKWIESGWSPAAYRSRDSDRMFVKKDCITSIYFLQEHNEPTCYLRLTGIDDSESAFGRTNFMLLFLIFEWIDLFLNLKVTIIILSCTSIGFMLIYTYILKRVINIFKSYYIICFT